MFLDPKLAVAVVIEQEGSILLGLRGEGTREPGKWSFPAGFVDRGECVEAAAAREVCEETGIQIRGVQLLDLLSREGETVVLAVYIAESFAGDPQAQDDLADVGWFDPHDPPPLAFPHDGGIIESWLRWRRKTGRSDNS
jgi:mutator protein MutT